MIKCKVHLMNGAFFNHATVAAVPHVGEYIWFLDELGTSRITYKVEIVVHASNGGEAELFVQREAAPLFNKG